MRLFSEDGYNYVRRVAAPLQRLALLCRDLLYLQGLFFRQYQSSKSLKLCLSTACASRSIPVWPNPELNCDLNRTVQTDFLKHNPLFEVSVSWGTFLALQF